MIKVRCHCAGTKRCRYCHGTRWKYRGLEDDDLGITRFLCVFLLVFGCAVVFYSL